LAQQLVERHSAVLEIRLFGSLERMEAVPGSDADVLIIRQADPRPRWFDRIPEFGEAFAATDMPVEVFPYTLAEIEELEAGRSGFIRAARSGTLLARRVS
jgi:predicted nucleotidyltransferase